MANENFGMMEGAFFVPKSELISWINDLLCLNITKVEQMASGAAYCQVIDIMFPGSIPMSKINWGAKYDHEFVSNYKLLQAAFDKNSVHKHIDVEKLIKAKYQDNLEFFQWFKRFYDLNCGVAGANYQAVERRKGAKTPWDTPDNKNDSKRNRSNERAKVSSPNVMSPKMLSPRGASPRVALPPKPEHIQKSMPEDLERIQNLEKQINEMKSNFESVEKERDFYFSKLRNIEIYCDCHELVGTEHLSNIQKILFASDTDKVEVNDSGNLVITTIPSE